MTEKSFVLLSLKDDKAKKLSKALSNESCRKILDYLASKGDATETQISKDLKVPISTIHYNMKLLAENGLVSMDEYHYSEKGKEVIHYKMRNRYIVIAPELEEEKSMMAKLKNMIPAVIILGIGTFLVGLFEFFFKAGASNAGANLKMESYAVDAAAEAAPMLARAQDVAPTVTSSSPHITLWFFAGGVFVLVCVLLWSFTRK
jgi:DNA-binding transcriptional ArsR family regulator